MDAANRDAGGPRGDRREFRLFAGFDEEALGSRHCAVAAEDRSRENRDKDSTCACREGSGVGQRLTGELSIDRVTVTDLAHASLRFAPRSLAVTRGKQSLVLRRTNDVVEMEKDRKSVV